MRFDKQMQIIGKTRVSDGMGGWVVTEGVLGVIQAYITPVKAEVMLKEYGIVSTTSFKVITREQIPSNRENQVQLQYGEEKYKIIQLSDFGKLRIALVEVV